MNTEPERNLEEEKTDLLKNYSNDELLMFRNIMEDSSYLIGDPITIIEIKSEVGTDGEQK